MEALELFGAGEALVDDEARHKPARLLGEKAYHLRFTAFDLLEHALDHGRGQTASVHRAPIFHRCQIDDGRVALLLAEAPVDLVGDGRPPKSVEIGPTLGGDLAMHL